MVLATLAAPTIASAAIPRGVAVWWGCMERDVDGPATLACPRGYDPRYAETVLANFERFTPENELKMIHLQPRQGVFDFSLADRIAGFAQFYGRQVRGHALVWGSDLPRWLTEPRLFEWDRSAALDVMRAHVRTVMRRFATRFPGVVGTWDVVNEPLDERGRLAKTFWATRIGPDYIERALRYADAADSSARLVINEVDVERPGPKADALLELVRRLKERDVPLDAVGFQMHLGSPRGAPPVEDLVALMRRFGELGVDVEITELDIPTPVLATTLGGNAAADQANAYRRVAQACADAGNCTGFSVWGVADPYSWRGESERALMFDAAFQPKGQVNDVYELLGAVPPGPPASTATRPRRATARRASRRRSGARRASRRGRRAGRGSRRAGR